MATTIYPAKVALKAALEAHTWPDSAPAVRWGMPTEGDDYGPGNEMLYLADVQVADDFVTLGAARLDETFALRVIVDVTRWGDDEQATEARAWQLRDEIVGILQADPTLGGAINRITGFRVIPVNNFKPNLWRTQIIVDAQCVGLEFFS